MKKWDEKNTNCNMVHVELQKTKKKNGEADVQVVTHRGEKIGEKFEHSEGSGQKPDGRIRKAPKPLLKFDVSQQKKFVRDVQRALEEERVGEVAI
jgi:hypothetical protein